MIKFRNAQAGDIDTIMELEKKSFIPQIQEDKTVFLERIKIFPELFLIFYDETDPEKKIGYVSAEFLEKMPESAEEIKLGHIPQPCEKQFFGKNSKESEITVFSAFIYISSFCIFPENRGEGLGKKCWNLAMNYFENDLQFLHFKSKGFLLLVNEEWQAAISIYKKSGFKTKKIFENFFQNQKNSFSNGILMEKSDKRCANEN